MITTQLYHVITKQLYHVITKQLYHVITKQLHHMITNLRALAYAVRSRSISTLVGLICQRYITIVTQYNDTPSHLHTGYYGNKVQSASVYGNSMLP